VVEAIDDRALTQLKELIGGDSDDLRELIETFLVEGEEIVDDMHGALAEDNVELLNRSAHSLKSSAQDFGASKLSSVCAALESACKSGVPDGASQQVHEITNLFANARDALKLYIDP